MPQASFSEASPTIFINELHYDNASTDTGEAIEIAGVAGTSLAGWSLVLYNGNGGAVYRTTDLSGVIPNQDDGYGTLSFSYPVNGIQNGNPDGIALVDAYGGVVQFLSYGGSFLAVGGPADGLMSTDIGITEPSTTPAGLSLQLIGQGDDASDFTWANAPAGNSFGTINSGQDFTSASTGPGSFSVGDTSVVEGDDGTTSLVFTVTRNGGSTGSATVSYNVLAGSASAEDVTSLPSGTLTFADGETSRTIAVEVQGDTVIEPDESISLELADATNRATISDGAATGTIFNDDLPLTAIYEIQGAGHASAFVNEEVATTGVVTAVDSNGFYLQDPTGDGNQATSDAIFVFTNSAPMVQIGDALRVTGTVSEFTPGGASSGNLSTTQIGGNPTVQVLSSGNALPLATLIGPDGRTPPTENIQDDAFSSFDPASDGIDFYESLEGMLVTVQDPVAVAPTNRFGEIYTVASDGEGSLLATNVSDRGTVNIEGGEGGPGITNQGAGSDFNPERIQIQADNNFTPGGTAGVPKVDTGAQLNSVTGVVSYGFGNYEVLATERITVKEESTLERETTTLTGSEDRLLVASYNVLNLDPNDADGSQDVAQGQFEAIARDIAQNLNSPDIIALQEVQDNDGATNSDVTSASETLQRLVDAIYAETGIRYEFIDNPFITNNASGGEPGSNIRTAFLYNPERVDFVEGSLATVVDPSSQSTDEESPFYDARLPLVATFEFDDEEVTIINNHFSSKGGSTPLFGTTQPSLNGSEEERAAQAQAVNNYVDSLLAIDASAKVVVLGDLNEFEFEEPLQILEGDLALNGSEITDADDVVLTNLTFQLAPDERYSYLFEGNSQSLDHILVSDALREGALFDAVHINTEFAQGSSDHDPLLASLLISDTDDETLEGSNGRDVLNGGNGDDLLRGRNAADVLIGGGDDDRLEGGNGDDLLAGDDPSDPLGGLDAGNDTLLGGKGDDMLLGGGGSDRLDGGRGDDVLSGGADSDVFVFGQRGFGRDRIMDFAAGEDVIDLGGLADSLSQIDTNGDNILDTRDQGVSLDGEDLVLALRGGVLEVAGVSYLATSDLLV